MSNTVENIIDQAGGVQPTPPKVERFVPQTLPGVLPLPEPGIYFGMPDEVYHALPALSSSGIKDLLASTMLYWSRANWLSTVARRREAKERDNPKTQLTRIVGKAYHARLLEGEDEYSKRFARELVADECKDVLVTTDQIKAAITRAGHQPHNKVTDWLKDGQAYSRGAKKDDWIQQLGEVDDAAHGCVWDVIQERHFEEHNGKLFVPVDHYDQIEIAAKMIEADPEVRHAFRGGFPEVTLIWYDEETGVPMKARLDRLKMKAVVDLKSITLQGRSIDSAMGRQIANYHYVYQPSVYVEGIREVRKIVRANFLDVCHVLNKDEEADVSEELAWAEKWSREKDEPKFMFVFQAKGDAPITRGVFYPMNGTTALVVSDQVRTAKRRFKEFSEAFGIEPWLDIKPIYDLADEDIPSWACDI